MELLTVFALATALAMDAFAVAVSTGIRLRYVGWAQTLRMAGMFGGCQFAMPVIGWLCGVKAQHYIEAYDHWLAFALLAFVGWRMVREGWGGKEDDEQCATADPTRGGSLWLLGIATSLDALAAGLSLALLQKGIWVPALIIGLVCFTFTACGLHIGKFMCRLPGLNSLGHKANMAGGVVLLLIGLNILREHGVFS